ncbi:hypothetical protein ACMA5I_10395 [Paracoccaceae bacterium GXU_MW_L88]
MLDELEQLCTQGGVYARSSDSEYFIYCVGQSIVKQKAFVAFALAHDIGAKPLQGCYKGVPEQSFISNMSDYPRIVSWLLEEESILHLHSHNYSNEPKATLRYMSGEAIELGRLRAVSRKTALQHQSWTYDYLYEQYFVTV